MSKLSILVVGIILALVVGFGILFGWRWFEKKYPSKQQPVVTQNQNQTEQMTDLTQQLLGGDRDEHGCIGSAGFSWCEVKQTCVQAGNDYCGPATNDDIFSVLKNIRNQGTAFSYPQETTFSWRIPTISLDSQSEEQSIGGLEIVKNDPIEIQQTRVAEYLVQAGFTKDPFNDITGVRQGFFKDSIACVLSLEALSQDNSQDKNSDKLSNQIFRVQCGHFFKTVSAPTSLEDELQNTIAKLQSRPKDQIRVRVEKNDATHVQGVVEYAPGGSENTSRLLAVKIGEGWTILFSGQSDPNCDMLKGVGFPKEVLDGLCQ